MPWILFLSSVRSDSERFVPVLASGTKKALEDFVKGEMADNLYFEGGHWKRFRIDSLLEWYNAPLSSQDAETFRYVPSLDNLRRAKR